jgi:hypothetical protein
MAFLDASLNHLEYALCFALDVDQAKTKISQCPWQGIMTEVGYMQIMNFANGIRKKKNYRDGKFHCEAQKIDDNRGKIGGSIQRHRKK